MSITHAVICLFLAALLGFTAHRASICTVKAVMEFVTTRRLFMLASFARAALWVMAIDLLFYWLHGAPALSAPAVELSLIPFIGGIVFGMGAAVNKGCAFATLNRLGSGDLAMLATLLAFVAGSLLLAISPALPFENAVAQKTSIAMERQDVTLVLTLLLWGWCLWQLFRLWRSRPTQVRLPKLVLRERYRLTFAAALIGISSGILFALHGDWFYTSTLKSVAGNMAGLSSTPHLLSILVFAAILGGIFLSAWQRHAFKLSLPGPLVLLRHTAGGAMMALGAYMIPGGNDAIILQSLPLLLPHAALAFAGILLGIFLVILAMKLFRQEIKPLDCSGDICWED